MIAREMIAEKVFAEGVAKDIRNFLPAKYENAEFQVMQMNKNNGVQMVGVQVRLQEENVCPVVYVEPFFNEIRLGEPVEWCCTIKVDIENSKGQYIEKDKQEATKDGSESTKIQHGI